MKACPRCRKIYPDFYRNCPDDRTGLVSVESRLRVGSVLRGKYEVLEQLGKGGMASVYKVRHLAFQDLAAIKVVHRELMADEFLKRFRNEAVVARQLKHPNAVRIEDFDYTDDGEPFLVMEYVHGRSLYELRAEMPEGVREGLRIAAGVAGALEAAHALGIVHRDIKPSNVMLTASDGTVKVLDFGVAKVQGQAFAGMTSVKTQASMIVGTPEYMSPEQATLADESKIDGRSDLYSLGVVLYELVTGVHPFRAETPLGMLMQQVQSKPTPPHEVVPAVSSAVSAVILKALQKSPEDRFQSAAEMLSALSDPEGWFGVATPAVVPRTAAMPVKAQSTSNSPSARMRRPAIAELPTANRFVERSGAERIAVRSRGSSWPVAMLLILLLIALAWTILWFYRQEHPGFDLRRWLTAL